MDKNTGLRFLRRDKRYLRTYNGRQPIEKGSSLV